ncbi:MAG: UDP-glucose 4-epimerase GalE, partial [Betaproteobacteria bacterium]|nr:UDP-glucose 4-epimerase GalE [Betaproteobacteria bacterium]
HTAVSLAEAGYFPVLLDNFCNADRAVIDRLTQLIGASAFAIRQGDAREQCVVTSLIEDFEVAAVIHFAALKAVGESVSQPLRYYDNNTASLIAVLKAIEAYASTRAISLVYSSSATVYGDPDRVPIPETAPLRPTNPYAWTKLIGEQIALAHSHADPRCRVVRLRYFNPVGAHASALIGEQPQGVPNNLMPYVQQVAVGKRAFLAVFGCDWPTADGTGVRDYLHVMDLAQGHVSAVDYLLQGGASEVINLGTGKGHSVLDLVNAFTKASGQSIPYRFVERRPGDIAVCYADAGKALSLLGWKAGYDLDTMCADAWRWQSTNPDGYQ